MKIVKYPDPILRKRMPEFDFANPSHDPIQLEKDMLEIMLAHDGIGLAANQVGIQARVFVMGHRDSPEPGMAFFNPEVVSNTEDVLDLEEGCLSFPGIFVNIKRPKAIKVRWQSSLGEVKEATLSGYECKCFLHELDHLEGIVFQDRVSSLKWALGVKKSKGNKKNVGR
jgi:peptide deformylase